MSTKPNTTPPAAETPVSNEPIVLQRPITAGERTVHELKFPDDPEFGLLEALDKGTGDMSRMFHLIAQATGEHVSVIKRLKPVDVAPVMEAAEKLMGELLPANISQQTSE